MKYKVIEDIDFPSCSMPDDDESDLEKNDKKNNSNNKHKIIILIAIIIVLIIIIFVLIIYFKKKPKSNSITNNINQIQFSIVENKFQVIIFNAEANKEITIFNPFNIGLRDIDYIITSIYESPDKTRILEEKLYNNIYTPNKNGNFTFNIEFNKTLSTIEGMFKDCIYLSKIDLSGIKFDNISRMNSSFFNCTSLEDIIFGSFKLSHITNMDNAFEGCSNLSRLDLSSLKLNKLESMKQSFKDCNTIIFFNLNNFENNEIEINEFFEDAGNLKIVIINDNNSYFLICNNNNCKCDINNVSFQNNHSEYEGTCNAFKYKKCFNNINYPPNIEFPIKCGKNKKNENPNNTINATNIFLINKSTIVAVNENSNNELNLNNELEKEYEEEREYKKEFIEEKENEEEIVYEEKIEYEEEIENEEEKANVEEKANEEKLEFEDEKEYEEEKYKNMTLKQNMNGEKI